MDDKYREIDSSANETALDVTSALVALVPWIGGPISNVLSGVSQGRKLERIREVLEGLAGDLQDAKTDAAEAYVKTEDFEELLEETLRRVSAERNEEKRRIYKDFLVGEIVSPGQPYEEQIRFVKTLEQLQPDHLRILRALMQQPSPGEGSVIMGSPGQTLVKRLSDVPQERIAELVAQLNDLRVTTLSSLNTMMTGRGASQLSHAITDYGQRFVRFLIA